MADVFLSHVEEDRDVALEIARGLEAAGYSVWYYERDTVPGVSYLTQISRVIGDCGAVVVVISGESLSSVQVDKEVDCAHESQKPLVPLLVDLTHGDFRTRQRKWAMAIGTIASFQLSRADVAASIPHILGGLRVLGIKSGASVPPSPGPVQRPGRVPTDAILSRTGTGRTPPPENQYSTWRLYGPWALATIVGAAAGAALGGGEGVLGRLVSADIIQAASKTRLGILALMIVVLGVLAGLFFGRASVQVRTIIFVLIFGGAVAFGAAVVRTPLDDGRPTPTAQPASATATKVRPTLEPTLDFVPPAPPTFDGR